MIYKRGKKYWMKFQHEGRMIYKKTGQTSAKKARQCEAKLRSELAMGNFGILERKSVPTLAEFIRERVQPKMQQPDGKRRKQRFQWLRSAMHPLCSHKIGKIQLDQITSEHVTEYCASRESSDLAVGTINRELRGLRRILGLAVEWKVIEEAPQVEMAGEEPYRERVVSDGEFSQYLLCASPLLHDVAVVLNDTGLRPDECHRLDWTDITFVNGRHGKLRVRYGKSKAARRELPLTARLRAVLEGRHVSDGAPTNGWIFPAPTKSGHINHSTLKKQHTKALRLSKVRPFVIYSLRHTFATRLATSPGMDAWTLCKIMGWSSLSVAMRYIHPSEDRVLAAFGDQHELSQSGDKTGDTAEITALAVTPATLLTD